MNFTEYLACDATALAQAVARGEVSATELLELALAQQARVHGRINAVCRLMEPQARAQLAGPLAGPFAGVPLLIKDVTHDYAGLPTSAGSRALLRVIPSEHSAVVRRFLQAGFVIFGKTNLPEFGLKGVTDPQAFGRTNNPWDPARTPGGSSGGAAAAIASGIVPLAAASDGGGSIRIPASYCGLFGLRPSRGRVSVGPGSGEIWFGASSEGVLSRSVRDSAAALDALRGPEPGDPFVIAEPAAAYTELMGHDPGRLRIGYSLESPLGTPVHAQAQAAVHEAVALLRGLGHEVEPAAPRFDGAALAASFVNIYFGQVAAAVAAAQAQGARREEFEDLTRVLAALGRARSAASVVTQLDRWNEFSRALGRFHRDHDLLLTPTVAAPAVLHGTGDPSAAEMRVFDLLERSGLLGVLARAGLLDGTIARMTRENLQYVPFTQLANLTGTPAMSVPLHWTPEGLPMGVQFVAPFGREDRLLQLARQLELARPWFHRLPHWLGAGAMP